MDINDEIVKECGTILKQLEFFHQELQNKNIAHDCQRLCSRCQTFQPLIQQILQYPAMLSELNEMTLLKEISGIFLNILSFVQQTMDRYEPLLANAALLGDEGFGISSSSTSFQMVFSSLLDIHYRQSFTKDLAKLTRQLVISVGKFNVTEPFDLETIRSEDLEDLQISFKEMISLMVEEILNQVNNELVDGGFVAEEKHLAAFDQLHQALSYLPAQISQYLVLMKFRPLSVSENKKLKAVLLSISSLIEKKRLEYNAILNINEKEDDLKVQEESSVLDESEVAKDAEKKVQKLWPHMLHPVLPKMSSTYLLKILGHPLILSRDEEVRKNKIISESKLPADSIELVAQQQHHAPHRHGAYRQHYAEQYCEGEFNPAYVKLLSSNQHLPQQTLSSQKKASTFPKQKILIKLVQDSTVSSMALLPKYLENEVLLLQYLQQSNDRTVFSPSTAAAAAGSGGGGGGSGSSSYHPNLLLFYGYSFNDQFYYLIFESSYYGNLQSFLFNYQQFLQSKSSSKKVNNNPLQRKSNTSAAANNTAASNTKNIVKTPFHYENDIPLAILLSWMNDIIQGLAFLHQQNILHGNLITQNIYLTDSFQCKIADFSIAQQILSKEKPSEEKKTAISLAFIAPEIRMGNTMEYTADIFSFAMICLHLITLKMPVIESLQEQIRYAVYHFIQCHSMKWEREKTFDRTRYEQLANILSKLQGLILDCSIYDMDTSMNQLRPTADVVKDQIFRLLQLSGGDLRSGEIPVLPSKPTGNGSDERKSHSSSIHPQEDEWKTFLFNVREMMFPSKEETTIVPSTERNKKNKNPPAPSNESLLIPSADVTDDTRTGPITTILHHERPSNEGKNLSNTFPKKFFTSKFSKSKSRSAETDREMIDDEEEGQAEEEDDDGGVEADDEEGIISHNHYAIAMMMSESQELSELDSPQFTDDNDDDQILLTSKGKGKTLPSPEISHSPLFDETAVQNMDDIYNVHDEVNKSVLTRSGSTIELSSQESPLRRKLSSSLNNQSSPESAIAVVAPVVTGKGKKQQVVSSSRLSNQISSTVESPPRIVKPELIELNSSSQKKVPKFFPSLQYTADERTKKPQQHNNGSLLEPSEFIRKPSSTSPKEVTLPNSTRNLTQKSMERRSRLSPKEKISEMTSENVERYYEQDNRTAFITFFRENHLCLRSNAERYAEILIQNDIMTVKQLKSALTKDEKCLLTLGFEWDDAMDIADYIETVITTSSTSSALTDSVFNASNYRNNHTNSQKGRSPPPLLQAAFQPYAQYPAQYPSQYSSQYGNIPPQPLLLRKQSSSSSLGGYSAGEGFYMNSNAMMMQDPISPLSTDSYMPSDVSTIYYRAAQCYDPIAKTTLFEAAASGDVLAEGYAMRMYALGQAGVERNLEAANTIGTRIFDNLRSLARSSMKYVSLNAQFLLGVCYSEGLGVPKSEKEGFWWYHDSAQQGFSIAQAFLGYCYYLGNGVEKNFAQAVKWYTVAAAQGHASAQSNLGICYEYGHGVVENPFEAVKWYKLAAVQGDIAAQYNLGYCYERGLGTAPDLSLSYRYYELAASKGHPAAQCNLGCFFEKGAVVPMDHFLAFRWFYSSACKGYPPAACKVGLCFEHGVGIDANPVRAVDWYKKSADKGYSQAQYHLASCYSTGIGMKEPNIDRAIELYAISAEKGYAASKNNLAYLYRRGFGVQKDEKLAVKLFRAAAEQGYPPAQYNLAYCYEKGYGVPKKLKEMVKWYRIASENGVVKATAALQKWTKAHY